MIFELVTGDYLFEPKGCEHYSRDEDHLALVIELLGSLPLHMIQAGTHGRRYFDSNGNLRNIHELKFWGLQDVLQKRYKLGAAEAENFADFLLPMLAVDPGNRASADQMLKHPWLQLDGASQEPILREVSYALSLPACLPMQQGYIVCIVMGWMYLIR